MICKTMLASSWSPMGPRWIMPAQAGLSWPQIGPSWLKVTKVNTKGAPSWLMLAPCWAKLSPSWVQVGPKLAHFGRSWSKWAHIGPNLAPRWQNSFMSEASTKTLIGSQLAPRWQNSSMSKASTKALPLRPWFSKMSTKALPQTFRRLIFRSGCSIFLFSNLKVVSFWVLLSACPVTAGRSKRFIQTLLSSGSCRQHHLEASSFFVHCTKAFY